MTDKKYIGSNTQVSINTKNWEDCINEPGKKYFEMK